MSVVLALQEKGVKVSVCGRLLEVSPDVLSSVRLLQRELATQIKLATPTSLQLADVTGKPIRSDDELASSLRTGAHPLQAKLTVVAVHEIEQKKHEAETKKEELVQLQWQIVVEQIASFSNEVATVASQLQGVKDDCVRAVRQFEDAEEIRRKQLVSTITQETAEREASQRDMLARVERLAQMITAERSARDVAVHQLGKQSEQVAAELDAERNARSKEQAENARNFQALRHDLELEAHKTSDQFTKTFEAAKRAEVRLDDHVGVHRSHTNRITEVDNAVDKLKAVQSSLELTMEGLRRKFDEDLKRRGEELDRAVRDGILGRENDITRLAKDLETSWHALEVRVQRARDEASEAQAMMNERAKALERRCHDLEQESADLKGIGASKDRTLNEKVNQAVTTVDGAEVERKANDVVVRSLALKVEDLMERMRTAEHDLNEKARHDHFTPHIESFYRQIQKQEQVVSELRNDMGHRFAQEAAQREGVKNHFQEGLTKCLDSLSQIPKEKGDNNSTERLNQFTKLATEMTLSPRRTITGNASVPAPTGTINSSTGSVDNSMTRRSRAEANNNIFDALDRNHDGQITRAEFDQAVRTRVVQTQPCVGTSKVMSYPVQTLTLHGVSTPQPPMAPQQASWTVGPLVQSPRASPTSRPMSARGPSSVPRLQNMP